MLQNLIVCILGFPPIQINDPMQQHYALQQQQQQQQQQQLLMRNIRCAKCGFFYPEIIGACFSCHPRKLCSICNNTPVFMDLSMSEDLQMFEYCTPECRNRTHNNNNNNNNNNYYYYYNNNNNNNNNNS